MTKKMKSPSRDLELQKWMLEDLVKSGLNVKDFTIEPLRSEEELKKHLGFTAVKDKSGKVHKITDIGGYWIPYPNAPRYYRLKLRQEIIDNNGNKRKYLSPSKSLNKGNHAYIRPEVEKRLRNYSPDKPIFISEGEKKAIKATLEGFPCIGLGGVWMSGDKENELLPELDRYNWADRNVYIVFDSDITQKHSVKHAELRLAIKLINRGGNVLSIRLPHEPNGMKSGLDDFLVKYGAEKLQELIQNAKPTLELHVDTGIRTEQFLKEISGIKSESERDRWARILAHARGIFTRAINKELKKYESKEEDDDEMHYIADFPGLVDLVEDENGNVAFLVREGNGLLIKHEVILNDILYYPPLREQLPFKVLPRAEKVLQHYKSDSDSKLYDDLVEYHKEISELPSEEYYDLLTAWDFHTYLLKLVQYSLYPWLYAIPERGKSRTGKGSIYVAYRGIHVESLRDAYLIRAANDLKASIFFDVMDLRKKAENAGSVKKLHKCHQRHSTSNVRDFSDDVFSDVFQDEEETSQKHHLQNTDEQRVSDVSGDDDVFSDRINSKSNGDDKPDEYDKELNLRLKKIDEMKNLYYLDRLHLKGEVIQKMHEKYGLNKRTRFS